MNNGRIGAIISTAPQNGHIMSDTNQHVGVTFYFLISLSAGISGESDTTNFGGIDTSMWI